MTHGREQPLRTMYWEAKLAAETEILDVVRHVESGADDALLDARPRDAWAREHIPGALSIPLDLVAEVAATLAPERQYAAYCWRST